MLNGPHAYSHLPLPRVVTGRPRRRGRDNERETQETRNLQNRAGHARALTDACNRVIDNLQRWRRERDESEAHPLPAGVPLFLKTEPGIELDFLRTAFDFEVIAEIEEGYILVASEDIELSELLNKAAEFEQSVRGSGAVAKVYSLIEDADDRSHRLERLLSPQLLSLWPTLPDDLEIKVDLGIACTGTQTVPNRPEQDEDETDQHYQGRLDSYNRRMADWWAAFDELMREREDQVGKLVGSYDGEVLKQTNDVVFPDSFTVRVRVPMKGLRDIVFNYPYLFEVAEPDIITSPEPGEPEFDDEELPDAEPPDEGAPTVAVVDSGVQEGHPLVSPAIRGEMSVSFVPGDAGVDDMVAPDGHGTRVTGALLYPYGHVPGSHKLPCWVCNIRVLDASNSLSDALSPQDYVGRVVNHLGRFPNPPRIVNHSISSAIGYRHRYMSAWGAAIDQVSYEQDLLFIQAAGNLRVNSRAFPHRAVNHHLQSHRAYPDYILREECRVANPAQSFQAVTVGSISATEWEGVDRKTVAGAGQPSAFTTSGLGIWGSIKPDVVEVGGDLSVDKSQPPISAPHADCSVELVRANLAPGGQVARDAIGTSFAAPRVAYLASRIQQLLPDEPTLLYRALIANAARWPEWCEERDPEEVLRMIGYGVPSEPLATASSDERVTLITQGLQEISASEAHVYRIPIPDELRGPSMNSRIRIDVTLSYAALPRRTRRNPRGYLSTWADWKSCCKHESYESFAARVVEELKGQAPRDSNAQIDWMLREDARSGQVRQVNRSIGTLQKDWVVMPAHELPSDFSIAVFGHRGWDKNSEKKAKYALAVSIEALDGDLKLYAPIQLAIDEVMVNLGNVAIRA